MLTTIGPHWDGNEVWLLTAGGATFAAFPEWYATMFSAFYLPLLILLVALIVRNMGFEYRGKRDDDTWRKRWDRAIISGSIVAPLLVGVALTNVVRGLPINSDMEFVGNLLTLLNPMSLLGGLVILGLSLTHGSFFLALKTTGEIRRDARALGTTLGLGTALLAVALLLWLGLLHGTVWTWVTTAVAAVSLVGAICANTQGREGWAFTGTAVTMASTVATYFLALYPNVMPTTLPGGTSLTIENAASSELTLKIMTVPPWSSRRSSCSTRRGPTGRSASAWAPSTSPPPSRSGDRPASVMRPFDPRLLRTAPAARRPIAVLAVVGVLQGVATIAVAFALAGLVVAVVEGSRPADACAVARGAVRAARGPGLGRRAGRGLGRRRGDGRPEGAAARPVAVATGRAPARPRPGGHARRAGCGIRRAVCRALPPRARRRCRRPGPRRRCAGVGRLAQRAHRGAHPPAPPVLRGAHRSRDAGEAERRWAALSSLAGHFLDVMRGLPTLVGYGRAERQVDVIAEVSQHHRRATMSTLRLAFMSSAALELLASISVAIVAVTCRPAAHARLDDPAGGAARDPPRARGLLADPPGRRRVPRRRRRRRGRSPASSPSWRTPRPATPTSASRGSGQDHTVHPVALDPGSASRGSGVEVGVGVRDVSYTYPGAHAPVLSGVTLEAGPGLTAAHRPVRGRQVHPPRARRRDPHARMPVACAAGRAHLVSQRPFLPAGTLRDALTPRQRRRRPGGSGTPCASSASRGSSAGLPHALATPLGDDGFGLSAGQRARIALARATLSTAPVLLVDEPTAHLDPALRRPRPRPARRPRRAPHGRSSSPTGPSSSRGPTGTSRSPAQGAEVTA